ncbi:Glycosyltransferase involved in cell wall bisynthesis [Pseudarthrobacter equi]|uniref:Glycosyltransferase involved in cell wall bisynthesis n=2 Tax=Pseudarthrobacter equi TaxID=728066 RepID=A0A1H2B3U0_9MICC|nr:Glycosyltransferase involved in cell wall bisynthesis [Pseudarthrobacter equi]
MHESGVHTDAERDRLDTGGTAGRLLLVTPYSPLKTHGHAADDLGQKLVEVLSARFSVDIYAPGQTEVETRAKSIDGVTYLPAMAAKPSFLRHFGFYPAGLRKDWSRANSRELRRIIESRRPDYLHVEYLQCAEAVRTGRSIPWSISLHDITSVVFRQRAQASKGIEKFYRWAEYIRVYVLERRTIRAAKHVFTLSARDAEWVQLKAPAQSVSHLRIGMDPPTSSVAWSSAGESTFVFAGAMWREPNIAVAEWLANAVMPLVWEKSPHATLRIVGARPAPRVLALAADTRIQVVGRVENIEDEYLQAAAVLAPTLVDAGILLKALRGMACGVPVILNSASADPLDVEDGVNCYVRDTPGLVAEQMIAILENPEIAVPVAAAGAKFVRERFSWTAYANEMLRGIEG